MKWILIIVWSSYYGHAGVTMQEFDTLRACQWASSQAAAMNSRPMQMKCVPKGDNQ